jgi:dTMP kinase
MTKGKLIVIDGSDGAGKSTQVELLISRLRKEGRRIETTNFPQEKNLFGALIKDSLDGKHGDFIKIDPYIVSSLYAADRFESKAKIEKWLASGTTVILDRYVSANQMHQGGKIKDTKARTKFLTWLDRMEHEVFGIPRPDLIVYLHVPVMLSQKLLKQRARKMDLAEKDVQHLKNTEKSALFISTSQKNWKKIDCTDGQAILSREAIHERIYDVVRKAVGV